MTTIAPETVIEDQLTTDALPLSADVLLRLRRLEAHVYALELTVQYLAQTLDRIDDQESAQVIRGVLDGLRR